MSIGDSDSGTDDNDADMHIVVTNSLISILFHPDMNKERCCTADMKNFDSSFVILSLQIKHSNTLRRVSLSKGVPLTFSDLQKKIFELFSLSAADTLTLTYIDDEGDFVTIADDSDVKDAVVHQGLNPLHLQVHTDSKSAASDSVLFTTSDTLPGFDTNRSLIVRPESAKAAELVQEVSHKCIPWRVVRGMMLWYTFFPHTGI